MDRKLVEIVRNTQRAELDFEAQVPEILEAGIKFEKDDSSLLRCWAHSVVAQGELCDDIVRTWPETEAAQ